PEQDELVADQRAEAYGKGNAEVEKKLVVLCEDRVVRGRDGHQVHQRGTGDHTQENQQFHGTIVQRCQSDARFQSREAIAFSWNGFGSWAVSRRMRIPAW